MTYYAVSWFPGHVMYGIRAAIGWIWFMNLSPTRAFCCKTKEQFNTWWNLELRSLTVKLQTEGDLDRYYQWSIRSANLLLQATLTNEWSQLVDQAWSQDGKMMAKRIIKRSAVDDYEQRTISKYLHERILVSEEFIYMTYRTSCSCGIASSRHLYMIKHN